MEKSFLNGIISGALAAQDQQAEVDAGNASESHFSAITEKDGYVGEMVKASLSIFEAKKPRDYATPFGKEYTVIINSMEVKVQGTALDLEFDADPIESIQGLIDYISDRAGLDLFEATAGYDGPSNKIRISAQSEYGPVGIFVGVDVYQELEPNKVLMLPNS